MQGAILVLTVLLWSLGAGSALAQRSVEKILPLDGRIAPDGSFQLSWFDAKPPRVGSVTIKRRPYGQTGGESWETLAGGLGPIMRYRDTTLKPGVAYEYQVLRTAKDIVDVGYWLTGTEIPAQSRRGTAHLVIDTTIAEPLQRRLERFAWDLVGDGWDVRRYLVPRGRPGHSVAQAQEMGEIKKGLHSAYREDPFDQHAVILIGHVPIAQSGRANPDGHSPAPHPTDLFYAEMDTKWRVNAEGLMLHNNLPSDFIETQIGRIDFSGLAKGNKDTELHLLRAYFDKNHHWRRGFLGDLRTAYGGSVHLTVDRIGLRNVVGPAATRSGGHHGIGQERPWLWGVDFGDHNGANYKENYQNRAVFTINFGSAKQRFDGAFNPMVALLAQPWYTLAVGWGGRPSWWPHHMALGGSIGDVHLRTVNNGMAQLPYRETMDYFPTGDYHWRNPVWVNLLGDPTARGFPLMPPSRLQVTQEEQQTTVSWQASRDTDVIGYKVYKAPIGSRDFTPLSSEIITETTFIDPNPKGSVYYMVRAYGLKQVYAGSFYTFSQGIFSATAAPPLPSTDMTLTTGIGQPVALPPEFAANAPGLIYAPLRDPAQGALHFDGMTWIYTPPDGFAGSTTLGFSISNALQTETGRLAISVTE